MRINRLVLEVLVAGVLITATILHGLDVTASHASPIPGTNPSIDSTTVARLSRGPIIQPIEIRATADLTGTLAATLAAELLIPINQSVYLPLIVK